MKTITPPIRRITNGPGFHWFGYYDKHAFDPTNRFVLGMKTAFEGRRPEQDDEIEVGMVDLEENDSWVPLGTTRAWCWQQGCMLQWVPGSASRVIWNDREQDRFVSRLLDVETGNLETLEAPIYSISPDGTWAVTPDFRRINDMRPGYGYAGLSDPFRAELAPAEAGIHRLDLQSGTSELFVSLKDVVDVPWPHGDFSPDKHYFNHLLVSPDGSRIEFLHRWYQPGLTTRKTRMLTCAADGSDLRIVCDGGFASHFIWQDPGHILVCCNDTGERVMCLIDVITRGLEVIDSDDLPSKDGHFTFLPKPYSEWLLTDSSSAHGERRDIELALFHVPKREVTRLGTFRQAPEYEGEFRVDLHPRASRDGKLVTIDSAHEGGRQIYLVDVEEALEG